MDKAIRTLIAAAAALTLSAGAYAQNNTLATPSTVSPAAAHTTSDYGTPGATGTDSGTGAGSSGSRQQTSANGGSTSDTTAFGTNNTLARPSTKSPAQ